MKKAEKQSTMDIFYKKLVQDQGKPGDQTDTDSDIKDKNANMVKVNDDGELSTDPSQAEHPEKRRKTEKTSGGKEPHKGEHVGEDGAFAMDTQQPQSKFKLLHKMGDLFSSPETESLAHCVSRDLGMGKGIAVLFKKKFGGVQDLKSQDKDVGDVAVLKRGQRFVYYLITKPKYWHKPTYDTLRDSLVSLKHHMLKHGVTNLSMPRIGCGLDMLQWPKVELILNEIFADMNLTITVYTLASK